MKVLNSNEISNISGGEGCTYLKELGLVACPSSSMVRDEYGVETHLYWYTFFSSNVAPGGQAEPVFAVFHDGNGSNWKLKIKSENVPIIYG